MLYKMDCPCISNQTLYLNHSSISGIISLMLYRHHSFLYGKYSSLNERFRILVWSIQNVFLFPPASIFQSFNMIICVPTSLISIELHLVYSDGAYIQILLFILFCHKCYCGSVQTTASAKGKNCLTT